MQNVDTLIHARWVIPVEPEHTVLEHHSIAITDGRIIAVLPTAEARQRYCAETEIARDEHLIIPGLINSHTHAAMNLMRGLADDLPLMTWLNEHIWPTEARWISDEFIHDGTQLAIAEMLRGGITCFNDMYFHPDITARGAAQVGMRAVVGLIVIDFPSAWAQNASEYLRKGIELHDKYHSHPLVSTAFAPHAPYSVGDAALEKVAMYAEELDLPIHMHVHETADEVEQAQTASGQRPLARLDTLGLLSPRLLAVHMTQLTEAEIERCAESGLHVVHCPESNLKLASGLCPVHKLHQAGVNVALGTDGAASNNDLDIISETRTAALLAKGVAGDASAVPAASALYMATLGGARALGLDKEIGSLSVGKQADITAIYLGDVETQPLYHPLSKLVYSVSRDKVTDVWVAGRHLLKERELTTLDMAAALSKARYWREKIHRKDEHTKELS
jgi:5-methylthioadenosine/S-adenosylhomocysteine deaminase